MMSNVLATTNGNFSVGLPFIQIEYDLRPIPDAPVATPDANNAASVQVDNDLEIEPMQMEQVQVPGEGEHFVVAAQPAVDVASSQTGQQLDEYGISFRMTFSTDKI